MTKLALDPPPSLRLVSCPVTTQAPSRDTRYRRAVQLANPDRQLHRQVLEWSLRNRCAVDPDAVRVVLAVRRNRGGPATRFTTNDVWRLMLVDIVAWCRARNLPPAEGSAHALLVILRTLTSNGDMHPDSDGLRDLEDALEECTGICVDELNRGSGGRWR